MNVKRYWLATLVVFVAVLILGWLAPMMGGRFYEATVNLWRSATDQMHLLGWTVLGTGLFSMFFCLLFVKGFGERGILGGVLFGLIVGLMMSVTAFTFYSMLPIPFKLAMWWIIGGLIETVVAGFLVGAIYHK